MMFWPTELFRGAGLRRPAPSVIFGRFPAFAPLLALMLILVYGLAAPVYPRSAGRVSRLLRAAADPIVFGDTEPVEPEERATPDISGHPHFTEAVGTANLSPRPGEGAKRILGTFRVSNVDENAFILRLLFSDGGVLRHTDSRNAAFVRLEGLELRYIGGPLDRPVERLLSAENFISDGGYYEVRFSESDIRESYDFELWGSLNTRGTIGVFGGTYGTVLDLSIEILP
jgi:hypothetical protein